MVQNMDSSEEDEGEEQQSSDNNESDSDNEMASTQKKSRKGKKPAAKNVASNIVLNTSSQLLEQVTQQANTQDTLYGKEKNPFCLKTYVLIYKHVDKALIPANNMDDIASGWVKEYKSNQMRALRNLINFVIRVS
jgi:hypothetical protein